MVQQLARSSCCKRYKITVREDKLNSLQTPFYVLNYWVLVTHFPYYARALKSPQKFRTLSFSSANFLGSCYTSVLKPKSYYEIWTFWLTFWLKILEFHFFIAMLVCTIFPRLFCFRSLGGPFRQVGGALSRLSPALLRSQSSELYAQCQLSIFFDCSTKLCHQQLQISVFSPRFNVNFFAAAAFSVNFDRENLRRWWWWLFEGERKMCEKRWHKKE